MIEPSNAERAIWTDITRDYVAELEASEIRLQSIVREQKKKLDDNGII